LKKLLPLIAFSILLLLPVGTQNIFADPEIFDNGAPNNLVGQENTVAIVADDFQVTQDVFLTDVHFFNFEDPNFVSPPTPWDGTLEYFIYNDNAGMPANPPFESGIGQNIQKMNIGVGFPTRPNAIHYEYSFDLENPIQLQAGVKYWIGLHLANDFTTFDHIYWEATSTGFGSNGVTTLTGNNGNPPWVNTGVNFAFSLTGAEIFVGGEYFTLDTTALLLAGIQTNLAWIIPVLSAAGIGAFILRKKF